MNGTFSTGAIPTAGKDESHKEKRGGISRWFFNELAKDVDGMFQVISAASRFQLRLAASIVSDAVNPTGPIPLATSSSAARP